MHLLIPAARRRTSHGLALVERTGRLPDPLPGRWPLAPVARAVLDFCRRCTVRDQVRSAIAEAVQRGYCTTADLAAELAAGGRRGRGLPGEVLREVGVGVRSVAEAKARRLILGSGLPVPTWNPRLYDVAGRFLAVPDAWFDEVTLAWEIDSVEWHLGPRDHADTLERRARLVAAGVVVVQDRPSRLHEAPATVLDTLRRALDQARRRPRPAVYAVPAAR